MFAVTSLENSAIHSMMNMQMTHSLQSVSGTQGADAGSELGVVSPLILGSSKHILGSIKTFFSMSSQTNLTQLAGNPISNVSGTDFKPNMVQFMK